MVLLPDKPLDQHSARSLRREHGRLGLAIFFRGLLLLLLLSGQLLFLVLAAVAKDGAFGHAIFFALSALHFESVLEIVQKKGWGHAARVRAAGDG